MGGKTHGGKATRYGTARMKGTLRKEWGILSLEEPEAGPIKIEKHKFSLVWVLRV